MTTYRLNDGEESEDFEAPDLDSAILMAEELLADWWKYADLAEHPRVFGNLYEVDDFDIFWCASIEVAL